MPPPTETPAPAPLGRRAQQKRDKRRRIREAAWQLFTTQGYDATTTSSVAKRARVATGTLFLYAKDKPDLLFLVFRDRLRSAVDAQFASMPCDAPLLEQLLHLFRGLFEMYAEHPAVAAEFVRALPGADGPNAMAVNAYSMVFLSRIAGLVQAAQERGEVSADISPFQAASNIFSLYFGALLVWLSGFGDLASALDPGLRSALELQMSGLRRRDCGAR